MFMDRPLLAQSSVKTLMLAKCRERKWLIRTNNLTELAPLDGIARLRFAE
jgi:hypothetical protein